jgi:hypothetical protein
MTPSTPKNGATSKVLGSKDLLSATEQSKMGSVLDLDMQEVKVLKNHRIRVCRIQICHTPDKASPHKAKRRGVNCRLTPAN